MMHSQSGIEHAEFLQKLANGNNDPALARIASLILQDAIGLHKLGLALIKKDIRAVMDIIEPKVLRAVKTRPETDAGEKKR